MFHANAYARGFSIDGVTTCDFSRLDKISNEEVLKRGRDGKSDERMLRFVTERVGIQSRYFVPAGVDALDLARDALARLVQEDPSLLHEAEFLIYSGISNPMPTVCLAALLAGELGFKQTSCWDLKSGCSTGVLALTQAIGWFQQGSRRGVIVCAETFSKFADPATLQMSASTGDGACAFSVSASDDWKVRGIVHGTDPAYLKSMYVPGKYPVNVSSYDPQQYVFQFEDKPDTLKKMAEYWMSSLADLLKVSGVAGSQVTHYFSHQVDGKKNAEFARQCGIPESAIFRNFENYGNMGCPTIFLNVAANPPSYRKGDVAVFHAVGGGLSWAAVCAEKIR